MNASKITNNHNLNIDALAPAKIILSGEHAVVYGCPALAMAISNYTAHTNLKFSVNGKINLNLTNLGYEKSFTWHELKIFKNHIEKRYTEFKAEKILASEILADPSELAVYLLAAFAVQFPVEHIGLTITIDSTIPIGAGLGSSSALIISMLRALVKAFSVKIAFNELLQFGRNIENMQHGFSSGLDLESSLHGGCILYQEHEALRRKLPNFPLQLINTGKPQSTTGECVRHVRGVIHDYQLDQFTAATLAMDKSLQKNELTEFQAAIKITQQLLQEIGVVPKKVASFINELATMDMAAKICGAGAISGDTAGVLVVAGNVNIDSIVAKHNYEIIPIRGEKRGSSVL